MGLELLYLLIHIINSDDLSTIQIWTCNKPYIDTHSSFKNIPQANTKFCSIACDVIYSDKFCSYLSNIQNIMIDIFFIIYLLFRLVVFSEQFNIFKLAHDLNSLFVLLLS